MPASPGDMIDHPTQSGGGDVRRAIPAFSWTLNEPADLYEEGWGQMPATIATSFTFSATLGGTKSDWFDGKIFFSIDGEPRHFSFSNKIITADISGLEPGIHNVYLLAASAKGEAGRSFEFEVLDKPPSMQVGIGIDDGKLHISPDRPMPTSQLGDLSRWNIEDFLADKRDIEVLPGNDEVVIGLTEERSFKDYMMYEPDGISPSITFNSTLGEMKCQLYSDDRGGDRYAQSGCTWGQLLPLEQCNDAVDGWTFDLQHFTSEEREDREALYMLIDEGYFPNGCWYTGKYSDSWSSCFNYVIVNYNWFGEGHLNPETNWYAQYDTVEYDPNNCGYKGVGYRNGRWEHYDRFRGYFPPSICGESRHQWEVIIDCNNCSGGYTYGYMSKGWIWGEDLEVDSTCPEFIEITAIPGEMLNDYVLNTLLSDDGLPNEGVVYNANHSPSGLWQYYNERCGLYMDDWNQANPGGICFVVKAHDIDSTQGRWIGHMLSIDLEYKPDHPLYPGERVCLEDEQMHYFYVDKDYPAETEFVNENDIWPLYVASGCANPLPTDGSPQGEYSCWIIRAGCVGEYYNSARFRIKDDCNNWTRSENMVLDGDMELVITYPEEGADFDFDDEVVFTAEIIGDESFHGLADFIKWDILTNDYYTIVPEWEDWKGPDFTVNIRDCELHIRAHLFVCGTEYSDERNVTDLGEIVIEIEAGIGRSITPGEHAPQGQAITWKYWIDGPSIPIFEEELEKGEGDWHDVAMENVDTIPHLTEQNNMPDKKSGFVPVWNDLKVGQIQIRISLPEYVTYEIFEVYVVDPQGGETQIAYVDKGLASSWGELDSFAPCPHLPGYLCETESHVWNISGFECGYYQIRAEGRLRNNPRGSFCAEDQVEVYLTRVKPTDLIWIAGIFFDDDFLWGGGRPPHWELEDDAVDFERWGTVDCSGYVHYLLQYFRQGLGDSIAAFQWPDSGRVEEIGNLREPAVRGLVKKGDIVLRRNPNTNHWRTYVHTMIFKGWDKKNSNVFWTVCSPGGGGPGIHDYNIHDFDYIAFNWVYGENELFNPCD